MKLAITGGAGFLGYHLCSQLADKFEEISVLDIADIDYKEYPAKIKYINCDIRNHPALNEAFRGTDYIIHAAAALPLWKKKDIFSINVAGTRNVLNAARNNNVKRVIFVSSTAVYGIPKVHPIYEDSPLVGVGPYGESKIAAEEVCRKYKETGMCIPIIRPKSFIGTGRLGVFQILYDWIESGKKIPIIGRGGNHYQLLEVDDLVNAIYLLITASEEKANDIFNTGAEEFSTVKEDLTALCEYASTGARIMPTAAAPVKFLLMVLGKLKLSPLYKWIYETADCDSFVSTDKIKSLLGWRPRYSNKEALIRSYKWYLEHKNELVSTGITHRVAWKQGILSVFKRFL